MCVLYNRVEAKCVRTAFYCVAVIFCIHPVVLLSKWIAGYLFKCLFKSISEFLLNQLSEISKDVDDELSSIIKSSLGAFCIIHLGTGPMATFSLSN